MKRQLLLIIFSLILSLYCKSQSGFLEGIVFDTLYKKPITFGTILITDINHGTYIDTLGRFKLQLPIGIHHLQMSRLGLPTITSTISIFTDSTTFIKIGTTDSCLYRNSSLSKKKCPKCHKSNKVIPILYGLPIGEMDTDNFYYGGCVITGCDPIWYCKRDKYRF